MRNRRTLSSQLTESFGTREKLSERKPATLGVTDSGPVEYPNRDNYVYVRLADNEVVPIYNQRVPKIAGLKVWVGYSKERPDVFQVLDVRDVFANPVRSTVAPHADDHTWPGADTVWVRGEQFLPGMVYPSSTGLVVSVFPLAVRGENNEWFVPRYEELNLSPYQPNSGSYWAVIEYNHTGALQVVTGPWVGVKENLTPDYIPVTSGTTLAAVALYGQGKINRSKKKTDIIDLRSTPKLQSAGGSGVSLYSQLGDVELNTGTLTKGSIPMYNQTGGYWENSQVFIDTKDPTGWENPEAVSVFYNTGTNQITLSGSLSYYYRGMKYSLSSPWTSSAHGTGANGYFLYSTDGQNFNWSTTAWNFYDIMVSKVSIAGTHKFALKETHGLMPWQAHEEFHDQIGTYYESGGQPITGTYSFGAATTAAVTPSFASAIIHDEDNKTTVDQVNEGTYTLLHVGASSQAIFTDYAYPFMASGSYALINTVSTGALAAAANNRYLNVYQILVPVAQDNGSKKYRMLFLQPQTSYTSLELALAEDVRGLSVGSLTSIAAEFVFFTRITYLTGAGYPNFGKVIIPSGGITYILGSKLSQVSVSGFTAQTAATISFTPTGTIASSTVQRAVEELMVEKANVSHTHSASDIVSGTFSFDRIQTIGSDTFLGRVSVASGTIEVLTPDQAHEILATASRTALKIPGDEASISLRFDSGRDFTEHFDVTGTPAGWTIQTGTPFTVFTPSYTIDSVFNFGTLASGSAYYLSRAGVPSGTAGVFATMLGFAAGSGFVGFRMDDGTDNNYQEVGIYKAPTTELQNIRLRSRTGGGAVTTSNGTVTTALPFSWISLFIVGGTPWSNWSVSSRWHFLNSIPSVQSNVVAGATGLTWTPSRFGLIARPESASVYLIDATTY